MRAPATTSPFLPRLLAIQALVCLFFSIFTTFPVFGQTASPAGTPSASTTINVNDDLGLTPQQQAQILNAVDTSSNTTIAVSTSVPTTPQQPPPSAPSDVKTVTVKEGVYLSWSQGTAASNIVSYNVYRSTQPGAGYRQVNLKPVAAPYFLDGSQTSSSPPQNSEDYFYVITAVDNQGRESPYSDEVAITPTGMDVAQAAATATPSPTPGEREVEVTGKNLLNFQLPADSQLSIQGYKTVSAQFNFQKFNRPVENGISPEVDSTVVNQELTVNLQGKVGKNVDVNVDYSDVNRAGGVEQSKQDISIVYHGDEDSALQQVAFGNLQLVLPNTEFAGFSKQLFGLEAQVKLDNFHFTGFFAQTQGIAETRTFKGNSQEVVKDIPDISYVPYKYFLITKAYVPIYNNGTTINGALPANGTEQIWVDNGNGQINPTGPNYKGPFTRFLPGTNYTMDYTTGIITFITGIPSTSRIVVGFKDLQGNYVGEDSNGNIGDLSSGNYISGTGGLFVPNDGAVTNTAHMIKDNTNPASVSPLYLVNYYSLGTDKIVPPAQDPNFLFEIISQGSNNVVQTGQGAVSYTQGLQAPVTINPNPKLPWSYDLNTDLDYLTVDVLGNTGYPERPFANPDGGTNANEVYAQTTTPNSLYRIHLQYSTQLNYFSMNRTNILKGSEQVFLDGRLLRRDVDYSFDYVSGTLDFIDKSLILPSSQIVVTYEYAPFGTFSQDDIFGARAEYDFNDNFHIGSTFLYTTAQQPTDVPQVGSTPDALSLIDADTSLALDSDDIQSITSLIPGLEDWKPPVKAKVTGEIAESNYDPDTYNDEGENGIALIDNMEGIDNVVGPTMNSTNWLVSSPPEEVSAFLYTPAQGYDGADDTNNNRTRFYNDSTGWDFQTDGVTQIVSGISGIGGHLYAQTGQVTDADNVLQVPYSHLSNTSWAGIRQVLSTTGEDLSTVTYFQSWIYNDGKDKWIMFDFGLMDEATSGPEAVSINEDVTVSGGVTVPNQANPDPNYGIPTFYMPGTPWSQVPADTVPLSFTGYNSGTPQQEGKDCNPIYITESMNGDDTPGRTPDTTDAYFEYGVRANWIGWREVNIPVTYTAAPSMNTTAEGISYFFNTVGIPNAQNVHSIRMWTTGTSASEINGYFLVENMSFSQNLWQLQVDPTANQGAGVTTNTTKFNVTSISQATDSRYVGNMRFIVVQEGQNTTSIQETEKSLDVIYHLSTADYYPSYPTGTPEYYCSRSFPQGMDFTDYQQMRMDLQIKSFSPGDTLFVRVGNDQQDYYQYNVPLNSSYLNTWNNVVIPLDGSGGNRITVGTPYINRTTVVSIGVMSPNPPSSSGGELWIDNLRLDDPNSRSGLARRADTTFNLGDNFATVDARYREVDSGFTELDQQSTRFQHSTQWGADYSSSGMKLFSQPLVTQFSFTRQKLYTETALLDNPYYISLPDTDTDNITASLNYTKDLGPSFGRLTSLRVAETNNYENDVYEQIYLEQPGVQGNDRKWDNNFTVASTYDAPSQILGISIGSNQFNQTLVFDNNIQHFDSNASLVPYDRLTRTQNYSWTNTTELFKDLVFTPGYGWDLTDAKGNTNSPGIQGTTPNGGGSYMAFQQQYQPKAGLTYRGIPGVIPSVNYTGSNQYDYVDYTTGPQFSNSNSMNYSVNLVPGTWIPFIQQFDFTVTGSRTDSSTAQVPDFTTLPPLDFWQKWWINMPSSDDLSGTKSASNNLTSEFKLFDIWDFRPSATWADQYTLLSQGSDPVRQTNDNLSLTTIYNKKLFTLPFMDFALDSAQLQFTYIDNTQFDTQNNIASYSDSYTYALTLPYEIGKKGEAQGKINYQHTVGLQNATGTVTNQQEDQVNLEYDQKFLENQYLHIPFTNLKIKFNQALEFHGTFLADLVNNQSAYIYNQLQTERYRGTIEFDYNALANLRVGVSLANEYFINNLSPTLSYVLWQGTISGEARF